MESKLDMSMMFAMHDALRRALGQVGRVASRQDDNPRHAAAHRAGVGTAQKFLTIHHQSEDDALWPPPRAAAADPV